MPKIPKEYKFFFKPIPPTVEEEKLKKLRSKLKDLSKQEVETILKKLRSELKELKSEQFWRLWKLVCIPNSSKSIEIGRNKIVTMRQEVAECVSRLKQ